MRRRPPTASWPGTGAAGWAGAQASQGPEVPCPCAGTRCHQGHAQAPSTCRLESEKQDHSSPHKRVSAVEATSPQSLREEAE